MKRLTTWKQVPENHDFTIYNLPWGIFSIDGKSPQVGMAIGDEVINMAEVAETGLFSSLAIPTTYWYHNTLNEIIEKGKLVTNKIREIVQAELCNPESILKNKPESFIPAKDVTMHLPVRVGDYTDFYSSLEHATNVGMMFRGKENALMPNWKHLPVAYHGRASSIIVSGTDIKRPNGQMKPSDGPPVYGPSSRMDFELEMAFIIGKESELGCPIKYDNAMDHIFGMVLFNDWSARDIQKWEYVPLGPFLGKNFGSSVSPWIVTMEALEYFKVKGPNQDPQVLPYLQGDRNMNYDIALDVCLITPKISEVISRSNYQYMYWNMAQQLAHHTVNGCNVRVGDMLASGTISGKDKSSYGSLLELTWGGKETIHLTDGTVRKFLEDGDGITLRGHAEKDGIRVGFGEVTGKIKANK